MAVLKCKMCGGELDVMEGVTVIECEYCGTKQTVPTSKDENLQGLFDRANILRMKSEFDKAEQLYEKIIEKDETQAEAYWGLILCKFGIEYVEDPATFKRIPTCHRTSFDSIIADEDYKSALSYADSVQRGIYENEAKEIDRLQKEILELSKKEEPYDVFICYKETDNDGKRTQDSVIANDIYHQLTQEGLKVFYAAITLENKLGSAYEPCIFAALNSAKVMLAIGTKLDYFNAVWVKNEWSRFLKIIQKDRSKLLIPCYRDMDAYELPEEFAHLQAQDMSKIGFINDVVRGIKKVVMPETNEVPTQQTQIIESANGNVKALLDRGFMALEDGEWEKADDFFEQALNFDAKIAEAYLGKLMAELCVKSQKELKNCKQPFDNSNNFQKAIRFGDDNLKSTLVEYIEYINTRNTNESLANQYNSILKAMELAVTEESFKSAAKRFEQMGDYGDAPKLSKECYEKAEIARKDEILAEGISKMTGYVISHYKSAITLFESIPGWKDADERVHICQRKIEELEEKEEQERIERVKQEQAEREERERLLKRKKKIVSIGSIITVLIIVISIIINNFVIPNYKYNRAMELISEDKYSEAIPILYDAVNIKDAEEHLRKILNKQPTLVDAGFSHTVGIKSDGTVVATKYTGESEDYNGQCEVQDWKDIVEVSAGNFYTVGLKTDGTVVLIGDNYGGKCNVEEWKDIFEISAGIMHTVGLKSNGRVVATGYNEYGQCDVKKWKDIVAISAGYDHTVGLKYDGTVVATGDNVWGQCDVKEWKDIVEISAGDNYTVGLKSDGTVVATGLNEYGECDVEEWKDIVAIFAGNDLTVGLKSDGTVVATGSNDDGQCEVQGWNLFK